MMLLIEAGINGTPFLHLLMSAGSVFFPSAAQSAILQSTTKNPIQHQLPKKLSIMLKKRLRGGFWKNKKKTMFFKYSSRLGIEDN